MRFLWISIKVTIKVLLFGKKAYVENNWQEICQA